MRKEPLPPRIKKLSTPVPIDRKKPEAGVYRYVLEYAAKDEDGGEWKRQRRYFTSWNAAEAACREMKQRARIAGEGALGIKPGDAEDLAKMRELLADIETEPLAAVREWVEAKRLLQSCGDNVIDVTREWAEQKKRELESKTVEEASELFLKAKEADGARPRYLSDLQQCMRLFSEAFAGKKVAALTPKDIADWIGSLPVGPVRRRNIRVMLGVFLNHAARMGWCSKGIIEDVPAPRVKPAKTETFTPDESCALLEAASRIAPALVPYLTLGLFCGLRTAELDRLDWQHVNDKKVRIEADVAKTASRRVVPIPENAAAWIAPYHRKSGPVRPPNARRFLGKVLAASGVKWKPNAMRHSFASYSLAATNDAPRVSLELGHMSPALVFRHYRALVSQEDAHRYFSIRPPAASSNVIPIAAGRR
ncbi:tyrosine-type recombinase/integrase [Methylacidimicrobium tartarophylax]|uniref:Tyrosine recombinase XerC n=1 Tax=Methylacidimicrobium tartarophylax TaxID=1041768 RepID=A0A5E6MEC3_9BACT|nr:tyrosine-type recombinase/integrase [Methylacidimicrobium tartarophylax]VVM06173.1 hypothetical protein MAMT_01023 [Methylacidimicrobium tartarophylax]